MNSNTSEHRAWLDALKPGDEVNIPNTSWIHRAPDKGVVERRTAKRIIIRGLNGRITYEADHDTGKLRGSGCYARIWPWTAKDQEEVERVEMRYKVDALKDKLVTKNLPMEALTKLNQALTEAVAAMERG